MLIRFKILISTAAFILAGFTLVSQVTAQDLGKLAPASERTSRAEAPATSVLVLPGNDSTSANGRAPQGTRLFINSKYVILASEMTLSGFSGPVYSVGWRWNNPIGAGAPAAQSAVSHGTIKVYLLDTDPAATALTDATVDPTGYTKIIDTTLTIPATVNEFSIDLRAGGPGTSLFTFVPGRAVTVLFQYQTTDPVLATPIGAPTVDCINAPANGIATYQSNTANGTAGAFSAFRPTTRFGNTPTAAGVSVSGRVVSGDGRGLTNAKVTLSDPSGTSRTAITNRSGAFVFGDVEAGRTYVISVAARRFRFSPRTLEVNDNVSDVLFSPDN